jgi:hypothetical protein
MTIKFVSCRNFFVSRCLCLYNNVYIATRVVVLILQWRVLNLPSRTNFFSQQLELYYALFSIINYYLAQRCTIDHKGIE